MDEQYKRLRAEVASRRTFAIISHPDAGKTTLTEKLLLYGGALHMAGSVRAKGGGRHTASDWMEIEKLRGISVSSSVLQFEYAGRHMNLLDTPGHNDFSEDTYRTLSAADTAIMLIDCVKGVEPQTIKLFQVCRMRGIPIVTFVNKMDREGKDPFDLLDEIERVLGIPCSPANWPIGSGDRFAGVYDRWTGSGLFFTGGARAQRVGMRPAAWDDAEMLATAGAAAVERAREDLALLDSAGDPFDREQFLAGQMTPVFFGSAMTNCGLDPLLDHFVDLAPPPRPRPTTTGSMEPDEPGFSGFVFKIQANMDPQHRDRIAFLRICSGRFLRGMEVRHVRTGKALSLTRSVQFMAQSRTVVDEAYSGDIVGLWDPGLLRIGDSLCDGTPVEFEGIPRFSPEHFVRVRLADPMKRKQLKKGLDELSEEGAVQLFFDRKRLERDPILGAVGVLQFEVIEHRLQSEYGVRVGFDRLPFRFARWLEGSPVDQDRWELPGRQTCVIDVEGRPLVLFETEWLMRRAEEEHRSIRFVSAVQPGRSNRSAACTKTRATAPGMLYSRPENRMPGRLLIASITMISLLGVARPARAAVNLGVGADWIEGGTNDFNLTLGADRFLARGLSLGGRAGAAFFDDSSHLGIPVDFQLRLRVQRIYFEGLVGPWLLLDSDHLVHFHGAFGFGLESGSLSLGLEVGKLSQATLVGLRLAVRM